MALSRTPQISTVLEMVSVSERAAILVVFLLYNDSEQINRADDNIIQPYLLLFVFLQAFRSIQVVAL